jgi:hypothetical protein
MGKKLPMIHSKIVVRRSKTGPVKKKIPLVCSAMQKKCYATLVKVVAPPHPIRTIENVAVARENLHLATSRLRRPHKSQRSRVRKSLAEIPCYGRFGLEVQLQSTLQFDKNYPFEKLWRDSNRSRGFDSVEFGFIPAILRFDIFGGGSRGHICWDSGMWLIMPYYIPSQT